MYKVTQTVTKSFEISVIKFLSKMRFFLNFLEKSTNDPNKRGIFL